MNRKERRAAEHQARKAARKAGFPTQLPTAQPQQPVEQTLLNDIPEPGAPFPSLNSMISPARLAANRANAQLSTGPSEAGKAISSQNRLTHGLARHNGVFKLLTSEDPAGFEALKASLVADHKPQTETEFVLVQIMAESHWLAQRAQSLQFSCLDPETGEITNAKMASLYLRYESTHRRAYHKSFNDLLKLRSERRKNELGFEAQRIKTEKHELKKHDHFWHILRKDAEACHQISLNSQEYMKGIREYGIGFKAQYVSELAQRGLKLSEQGVAELKPAA